VGTFALRALPLFIANRCGIPVPITRDAAIWTALFTLLPILGYCFAPFPKSPWSSLAWLLACRCDTRCCLWPRGDGWHSSVARLPYRLRPAWWARLTPNIYVFSGLCVRFRAAPFTSCHTLIFPSG